MSDLPTPDRVLTEVASKLKKGENNRDTYRYLGMKVIQGMRNVFALGAEDFIKDLGNYNRHAETMATVSLGVTVKIGVHSHLFLQALLKLGSEKHKQLLHDAIEFKRNFSSQS